MTPEDVALIFEPIWAGMVAARVRVLEKAQAAESLTGREAYREIGELQQVADFLEELSRRLEPDGLYSAWTTAKGRALMLPVNPKDDAAREAMRRYLENRPDARALLEEAPKQRVQIFNQPTRLGCAVGAP